MTEQTAEVSSKAILKGGGFYDERSRPQQNAISFGLPLLAHACETAPPPRSGIRFVIVDYGASLLSM
jgi:hypothetical protein